MHLRFAATLQARHGDLGFMQAGDFVDPQAVEIRIVHSHVRPPDWLATRALRFFELCGLLVHINTKKGANNNHAHYDPYNTERVSDGI